MEMVVVVYVPRWHRTTGRHRSSDLSNQSNIRYSLSRQKWQWRH